MMLRRYFVRSWIWVSIKSYCIVPGTYPSAFQINIKSIKRLIL